MTPDVALDMLRRQLAETGEVITVRRYAGAGASRAIAQQADVLARVMGYQPKDIAGAVQQGDRRVIMINDPYAAVAVGKVALSAMLPLSNLDVLSIRDAEIQIVGVDDSTRRIAGTLIGLDLQVRG